MFTFLGKCVSNDLTAVMSAVIWPCLVKMTQSWSCLWPDQADGDGMCAKS